MFYCCNCGAPLYGDDKNNPNFQQNQNNGQPNPNFNQNQGMPPFGVPFGQSNPQMAAAFDPMAGMKSDEPLGFSTLSISLKRADSIFPHLFYREYIFCTEKCTA